MRASSVAVLAALSLAALPGCIKSDDREAVAEREVTAEAAARGDYARIAGHANAILFGDGLGYRAGATVAERVSAACRDEVCSLGFGRAFSGQGFSVEDVELELLTARNGVRMVVERGSTGTSDVTVFGGWMNASFFASQANRVTDEKNPNFGATIFYSYAVGLASGWNPSAATGRVEWRGFVVGREASVVSSLDSVVLGDATIAVETGPSGALADVAFTGLANAHTGATYDDMTWNGMAVEAGGFVRDNAAGDTIEGRFFGPEGGEVGGVFERAGIAGAFGGRRPEQ